MNHNQQHQVEIKQQLGNIYVEDSNIKEQPKFLLTTK